jgi:hypothetical protein
MRKTSKVWYWIGAGLFLPGVVLAIATFVTLSSRIADMQRVVMPGRAEIVLPAGRSTLYAESQSIVDGKVYQVGENFSLRCGIGSADGTQARLESSSSTVSYSLGDYAGQNAMDVHAGAAGTYVLECEAPGTFVMAIGGGIGTSIVLAVVGGLAAAAGALMTLVVWIKRRRQIRREAEMVPRAVALGES